MVVVIFLSVLRGQTFILLSHQLQLEMLLRRVEIEKQYLRKKLSKKWLRNPPTSAKSEMPL